MNSDVKIILGILVLTVVIIGGGAALLGRSSSSSGKIVDAALLVKSGSPTLGPENAPVAIVEFADFQCPACAAAHPVLQKVFLQYGDKVRFVFRHFPLTQTHEHALAAASAAEAAKAQGKFWEMHDLLLTRQSSWSQDGSGAFTEYAKELGLDTERFTQETGDGTHRQRIEEDAADGRQAGVNQTPTIFINGKPYMGSLNMKSVSSAIDAAL